MRLIPLLTHVAAFLFTLSDKLEQWAIYLQSKQWEEEQDYARSLIDEAYPTEPPQFPTSVTYIPRHRR